MDEKKLLIGWGHEDITPGMPVMLMGQFQVRVAQEVLDPVTATALAIESADHSGHVVMVSLDLAMVFDCIRQGVREKVAELCDGLNPDNIWFNATHTHTAMVIPRAGGRSSWPDVEGYDREKVAEFVIEKTAAAVKQAWDSRAIGAISFGVSTAVIGSNRRSCYRDKATIMYGDTSMADFTHLEGSCDHDVNLMCTYDEGHELTGMVVNVPCPSQVVEGISKVSADFWHDVRCEIKQRHGKDIYVLAQCSAAGDLSPHFQINPASQRRMLGLKYDLDVSTAWRQEIANRIANAVDETLPIISKDIRDEAVLINERVEIALPLWKLTQEHVELAQKNLDHWQGVIAGLEPDLLNPAYSNAHAQIMYYKAIIDRYDQQAACGELPTEISITRLADIAFATNRFELLLDFGQRIKTRSRALQTFVVQLAGEGTYLAPHRSCGQGYGATPMDGQIGPDGGDALVEQTLESINTMFEENLNPFGARF